MTQARPLTHELSLDDVPSACALGEGCTCNGIFGGVASERFCPRPTLVQGATHETNACISLQAELEDLQEREPSIRERTCVAPVFSFTMRTRESAKK